MAIINTQYFTNIISQVQQLVADSAAIQADLTAGNITASIAADLQAAKGSALQALTSTLNINLQAQESSIIAGMESLAPAIPLLVPPVTPIQTVIWAAENVASKLTAELAPFIQYGTQLSELQSMASNIGAAVSAASTALGVPASITPLTAVAPSPGDPIVYPDGLDPDLQAAWDTANTALSEITAFLSNTQVISDAANAAVSNLSDQTNLIISGTTDQIALIFAEQNEIFQTATDISNAAASEINGVFAATEVAQGIASNAAAQAAITAANTATYANSALASAVSANASAVSAGLSNAGAATFTLIAANAATVAGLAANASAQSSTQAGSFASNANTQAFAASQAALNANTSASAASAFSNSAAASSTSANASSAAASSSAGLAANANTNASHFAANASTFSNTAVAASGTANSAAAAALTSQTAAVSAQNAAANSAANASTFSNSALISSNNANSANSAAATFSGVATSAALNANTAANTAILQATISTSNATASHANALAAATSLLQAVANASLAANSAATASAASGTAVAASSSANAAAAASAISFTSISAIVNGQNASISAINTAQVANAASLASSVSTLTAEIVGANSAISTLSSAVSSNNAAQATTINQLTVSLSSPISYLNLSPTFADWLVASTGLPTNWIDWAGPTTTLGSRVAGLDSPYALRLNANAIASVGILTRINNISLGWYVVEGHVTLNSGGLVGSGCLIQGTDAIFSVQTEAYLLSFGFDQDTNQQVVGNGVVGQTYYFSKTVQLSIATTAAVQLYAMGSYSGFSASVVNKNITIHKCALRAATPADLQVGSALQNLGASSLSAMANTIVSVAATANTVVATSIQTLATKSAGNQNLLPYGGFEQGFLGWTQEQSGVSGASVYNDPNYGVLAYNGLESNPALPMVLVSDQIPLTPLQTYTYSGNIQCVNLPSGNTTSTQAYLDMQYYNSSNTLLLDGGQIITSRILSFATQGPNYVFTETAPSGTAYGVFRFISLGDGVSQYESWCQRLKVEAGSVATPFTAEASLNQIGTVLTTAGGGAGVSWSVLGTTPGGTAMIGLTSTTYGTSLQLQANKVYFGSNITVDEVSNTIQIVNGSYTQVLGAGFGAGGNLTNWYGSTVALSSMTANNALFWIDNAGNTSIPRLYVATSDPAVGNTIAQGSSWYNPSTSIYYQRTTGSSWLALAGNLANGTTAFTSSASSWSYTVPLNLVAGAITISVFGAAGGSSSFGAGHTGGGGATCTQHLTGIVPGSTVITGTSGLAGTFVSSGTAPAGGGSTASCSSPSFTTIVAGGGQGATNGANGAGGLIGVGGNGFNANGTSGAGGSAGGVIITVG